MLEDGALSKPLEERYAGWIGDFGKKLLGGLSLEEITAAVEGQNINPRPKSGRQEYLENVVNRYVRSDKTKQNPAFRAGFCMLDLIQRNMMRCATDGKTVELLIVNRCFDLHHSKHRMKQIVM